MKKKFLALVIVCIFIGMIIGLLKINKWIQAQVSGFDEQPVPSATVEFQPIEKAETPKPKKRTGEVIRKTRLAPERTFERSIFYQGGKEIARHKVSKKGMIYDQTGKIPNGKVKFINETNQTYGVEYYLNGVRDGPARVKYKDGPLKYEAVYQYGKLVTRKEYYYDGTVKMEEDYTDAREYDDGREVGIGKVYSRDGIVKFEWYLINSDPVGYHKFNDGRGRLKTAIYFDKYGNVIPSRGEGSTQNITSELSPYVL